MYVQFLIRKSRKRKNIHLQNDWSQVLIPGTANFNQIFQNPPHYLCANIQSWIFKR